MECEIKITIRCDDDTKEKLKGLIGTFGDYDRQASLAAARSIDKELEDRIMPFTKSTEIG